MPTCFDFKWESQPTLGIRNTKESKFQIWTLQNERESNAMQHRAIQSAICNAMFQNAVQCDDMAQNACSAEICIELLLFAINYC